MIWLSGAGGFLGSALLSAFKNQGKSAIGLFRSDSFQLKSDEIRLNLVDSDHWRELARSGQPGPKTFIHLAGRVQISFIPNPKGPGEFPLPGQCDLPELYRQNVFATAKVIEFCLASGVEHLLFASSQTVYGRTVGVLREDSPCQPLEHYAASKFMCEQMLALAARQGLRITILRFPGLYHESRRSGAVYHFMRSAIERSQVLVKSEFPLPFDVIHRDDVIDATLRAIDRDGPPWECFNIATGEDANLVLIARTVAEVPGGCTVSYSGPEQPVIRMEAEAARSRLSWSAVPRKIRFERMLNTLREV